MRSGAIPPRTPAFGLLVQLCGRELLLLATARTNQCREADFFARHGLLVHYTDAGIVEAIEMGSPAAPVLMGRSLIGTPFDELYEWMRSLDPRVQADEAGLTSLCFGVGCYAPHAEKSPHDPVEGVIVFRPGYYG